jgi:hypothetical protein
MAMSASRQPARQIQEAGRLNATAQTRAATATRGRKVPTRWLIERGATRAAAAVDVRGGFPGSIGIGNHFPGTKVVVSARYLVVGEGDSRGFALRLHELRGAGIVRPGRQALPALVIRYQDGDQVRTFGLEFRGLARTFSGRWRAEEVLQALEEGGVPITDERSIAGPGRIALTWDQARERAGEELRWSGETTAAVGGWFCARRGPCRVWLTVASIFWSTCKGNGVNRLALDAITGARAGDAATVVVSTADGLGHQYEIPFTFERAVTGENPDAQRAAFLDALRAAGVAIWPATPALAPWIRGGTMPR